MTEDSNYDEIDQLVSRLIEGILTNQDQQRLNALLANSPDAVRRYQEVMDNHEALCTIYPGDLYESLDVLDSASSVIPSDEHHVVKKPRVLSFKSVTVALIVASVVLLFSFVIRFDIYRETTIATVTGLNGSLTWTGDRGQIVRDITIGTELDGGTIEGMAPDSWFELKFNDESKIGISGISMLTFSDDGQKVLRLREGQLTADVNRQPTGRPMLVHTRTALIEVLGTRFDVQSALASTILNVSEGIVRLRRLSDGSEVNVPAEHLVIADDESQLVPEPVPLSVSEWTSDFNRRPDNYGKWKPATHDRLATVKAIPLIPPDAPHVTLQLAGISVRRSDGAPVVIQPGSRFVVKGRIKHDTPVYFGIRVNDPDGEFAGMFRGDLLGRQAPVSRDQSDEFIEIYQLKNFSVDPAVWDKRHKLKDQPENMILDGVWAFTHSDPPSGLEVTEIQLVPPQNN